MNKRKIKDLSFGHKMEHKLYKKYLLKKYPNTKWMTYTNKFSKFDFHNGNKLYELKARRYNKKTFDRDGFICELSKIQYLINNPQYKGKIYFMFYDGLWVYNVSKDNGLKGIQIKHGGRKDRGRDETKDQAYIHRDYLKLVSTKICCPEEPTICLID